MSALPTTGTAMRGDQGSTLDTNNKRVFTVFCHGTGGHRDGKCEELITEFGGAFWHPGNAAGRPIRMKPDGMGEASFADNRQASSVFYAENYMKTFLILDGVGTCDMATNTTKSVRKKKLVAKKEVEVEVGNPGLPNPMPGDFDPFDKDKPLKDKDRFTTFGGQTAPADLRKRVSDMKLKKMFRDKHRGDIYGDGWNDNIAHALWVLRELRVADVNSEDPAVPKKFPRVINAIGWSRGAVTTIKLAYWIDKYFVRGEPFKVPKGYHADDQAEGDMVEYMPALEAKYQVPEEEIEMNLFAIDPVPGRAGAGGAWFDAKRSHEKFPSCKGDQDYREIAPIVNNCIITLALDERREGFHPLDAEKQHTTGDPNVKYTESKSNVVWLPYPGIHRTQLRLTARDPAGSVDEAMKLRRRGHRLGNWRMHSETDDEACARIKGELTAMPRLVWDLAWKFLTFHGTKFQRTNLPDTWGGLLSGTEILELAEEVIAKRPLYHTARNRGGKQAAQGGLKYRSFTGYPRNYKPIPSRGLFPDKLGDYVRGPHDRFLNEHHRAVHAAITAATGAEPSLDAPEVDPHAIAATDTEYQSERELNEAEGVLDDEATPLLTEAEREASLNTGQQDEGGQDEEGEDRGEDDATPLLTDAERANAAAGDDDEDLPEDDGQDPPAWPRTAVAGANDAIFKGRLEEMTRSRCLDAAGRPIEGTDRPADDAKFIGTLIMQPTVAAAPIG
jgi:hypothetical protein